MEGAALVAIAPSNAEGTPPGNAGLRRHRPPAFHQLRHWFLRGTRRRRRCQGSHGLALAQGRVHRDGKWREIESTDLAPGDMAAFKIGDVVPADCRLDRPGCSDR